MTENLEHVAATKSVTIPLEQYNKILDENGLIRAYLQKRNLELDTELLNSKARIAGLEERIEQQLRFVYGLIADTTARNERLKAQLLQALKNLIEVLEP